MTTICAFSDTHLQHRKVILPPADILVFAGDALSTGFEIEAFRDFLQWFGGQPHKIKVMIAGNHDRLLDRGRDIFERDVTANGIHYLLDSGTELHGLKFWGSPYTPQFNNWAFNRQKAELPDHWEKIPSDVDVLITHGPPHGILDGYETTTVLHCTGEVTRVQERLGDPALLERVMQVLPKVHIFGHIHSGYGQKLDDVTRFYNVAVCNEQYKVANAPQLIEV